MNDLIKGLIIWSIILSPIILFFGFLIAIFSKEKRLIGVRMMIISIIIFLIAMGTCLTTSYVTPFSGH
jgi:hypothetical protein